MSRIGAQLSGFERQLLNSLAAANAASAISTLRIATGQKINRAADDPAAFLHISGLETQLTAVKSAVSQTTAASTVAAEAQLTLDQIRTELTAIRTALVSDEEQGLTSEERTEKQAEIDAAIGKIGELARIEINGRRPLSGDAEFTIQGADPAQIESVQILELGGSTQLSARKPAELTYTGTDRQVTSDANITVSSSGGSHTLSLTAGQTLQSVADSINGQSGSTGVRAEADGSTLRILSVADGKNAYVSLEVNSGTFNFSGGTSGTAFGANPVQAAGPSIAGEVTQAATQATATYTGSGGKVTADATFTITGSAGSAGFTVANNDTLDSVATKINNDSHITRVTAEVSGDALTLRSIDYGTSATVQVAVSSGTFDVSGVNGSGTARGSDLVAEINGVEFSGNSAESTARLIHTSLTGKLAADADITVTGDLGSASFSLSEDDTLSSVASTINGQTTSTGVKASLSADGLDLVLESTNVGDSATVDVRVTDGSFAVAAADSSTVTSQVSAEQAELVYTGSNGKVTSGATITIEGNEGSQVLVLLGSETLSSVAASINDQTGSTGVKAEVDGDTLTLLSVEANAAAFVDVDVTLGTFDVTGGDGNGRDTGVDAQTAVQGQELSKGSAAADGNSLRFNRNGTHFVVDFAAGFTGTIDTVSLSDERTLKFALTPEPRRHVRLGIRSLLPATLGGASGKLTDLLTGGSLAGLDTNTSQAIRVVDEALSQLSLVEGGVDGLADSAIASSSALMSALESELQSALDTANKTNADEENLLIAKNNLLVSNSLSALSVLQQQQQSVVSLIQGIAGFSSS